MFLFLIANQSHNVKLDTNSKFLYCRRKIITKCQDVISKCLTTLFSKPNGGELEREITNLRSIQSILNRM